MEKLIQKLQDSKNTESCLLFDDDLNIISIVSDKKRMDEINLVQSAIEQIILECLESKITIQRYLNINIF